MSAPITTIKIPTKPHLKKYLLKQYDQQEPFRLDERTSIGKNLMSSVVDKLEYVNVSDHYTTTLEITLSTRFTKRGSQVKRFVYINSLLEEMFKEALILWIYCKGTEGTNPSLAAKDFLAFFGIDESEYTYAAAYKTWQNYKIRNANWLKKHSQNRTKFIPNLSPSR
jgi:hypothetical protein